eukprot:37250-Amorphochlora_amoeboformis.AAC.1
MTRKKGGKVPGNLHPLFPACVYPWGNVRMTRQKEVNPANPSKHPRRMPRPKRGHRHVSTQSDYAKGHLIYRDSRDPGHCW